MTEHKPQRRDKRFRTQLPVRTRINGRLLSLMTDDESYRGMFLCSESPPPVRQLIRIETILPPNNVPFATLLRDGHFAPPADLQDALGPTRDSVAYCGSGISACVLIAAAAAAGQPLPRLYPGSWSEWSQAIAAPGGNR